MRFSPLNPAIQNQANQVRRRTVSTGSVKVCAVLALAVASLSGCSQIVTLDAAPDSNNPKCAAITVRLPDSIENFALRDTDAQATGAWGTPSALIIRCGLPEVKVSALKCVTAGGVDWLVDPSQAPSYRFITFGRNPATEVIVDSKRASGVSALEALAPAVLSGAKAKKVCTVFAN
jgi:uncharacterized protein YceK